MICHLDHIGIDDIRVHFRQSTVAFLYVVDVDPRFREDLVNEVQRIKELSGELLREKLHKRKQEEVMESTSRVSNTPDGEQGPAHVRRKPSFERKRSSIVENSMMENTA